VLSGHDHDYERFAPQDAFGFADPVHGVREFVVGTGGKSHYAIVTPRPNSEMRDDATAGVLKLTLRGASYEWQFLPVLGGSFIDQGGQSCGTGARTDTTAPTPPSGLTATVVAPGQVNLSWLPATDDTGVTGYEIDRNGQMLTTVGSVTAFTDTGVFPGTTYRYEVRARDADANWSALSAPATVATAPAESAPLLFEDRFETGGLGSWAFSTGVTIQSSDVYAGAWAARAVSTGGTAYAYVQLPAAQAELYARVRFKVASQGANSATLLKLRTATGSSVIAVYRASTGKLSLRNDAAGITTYSATGISEGVWHEVELRARVDGSLGETEVWYDGGRVADLSLRQSLGTTLMGRLQIGESTSSRSYDIAFDDVAAAPSYIDP
jgi:hypothetical protein